MPKCQVPVISGIEIRKRTCGYYYVSVLSKRGRIKRCTLSLCPSVCPVNDPNSRTERRRKFIFDLRGCVTRVTSRASTSFVWLFRGMGHITRWTLSVGLSVALSVRTRERKFEESSYSNRGFFVTRCNRRRQVLRSKGQRSPGHKAPGHNPP